MSSKYAFLKVCIYAAMFSLSISVAVAFSL
jgi:hypothetical protein